MTAFSKACDFFVRNLDMHRDFVLRYLNTSQKRELLDVLVDHLINDIGLPLESLLPHKQGNALSSVVKHLLEVHKHCSL